MLFAFLFGLYVTHLHCSPDIYGAHFSDVVSTIFLWMVDVEKSRIECEEFILAEKKREAFETNDLGPVSHMPT
jgi:hypothetical protein